MAQIAPLYAKITNPRNTDGGQGSLPSIRDLYKGLSLSSQFKVSLFKSSDYYLYIIKFEKLLLKKELIINIFS